MKLLYGMIGGVLGALCGVGLLAILHLGISIVTPGGCFLSVGEVDLPLGNLEESTCFSIGTAAAISPVLLLGIVGITVGLACYGAVQRHKR